MSKFEKRVFVMVGIIASLFTIALALISPKASAYNNKPSGVAYEDPNFSELWLNGVQVTATAEQLNLLADFSTMSLYSLAVAGGTSVNPGEASVATYSVAGISVSDLILWGQTSAVSDAASRSLVISNIRASGANELEVTTVNASQSAVVSPAATFSFLVVQ